MLPKYFYDLNEPIDLPGWRALRWRDDFVDENGDDYYIYTPEQLRERQSRDLAYKRWMALFDIPPRILKWQMIRVLNRNHANPDPTDWWPEYKDALFRVFVNPYYTYHNRSHYGFYVLCPEDSFLVKAYEQDKRARPFPPRASFKHICPVKKYREMLVVPIECCRHMRHETTAGRVPDNL